LKLSSASSLLEAHLVSFTIVHFSFVIVVLRAAQRSSFCWIVSSVQTHCLYCRFGSILVRLTVTTDSLNLLSLLSSLLELLFIALTLGFNSTIDAYLVDLVGSCLFEESRWSPVSSGLLPVLS